MIRSVKIFTLLLLSVLMAVSCKKEDYSLGSKLDKSDIKFEVVQDLAADPGGNTVILKNETPGTISMWDYGTGKSNRATDTVHFAFKGDYVVKFSAVTAGGVVNVDEVTVKVTEDNLNYVNDPLWTALTGGVGNEKEWVLDTEGKFFAGPLSFYGTNNGWLQGGGAWSGGSTGCYGGDCWNWGPGTGDIYPNMMAQGDYGVMTFSLKGSATFKAVKPMEGGITQNGTYFLDVNNKILTINNASILRGYKPTKNGISGISNWTNYTILSLDENSMQLAVIRDHDVDGEGPCLLVYNFISKDYSDHWVPPVTGPDEGFDPSFAPGELLKMLTGGTASARLWKLDAAGNPVDWIAGGKGWTKAPGDSDPWGWNASWNDVAADSWILFDNLAGQKYTRNQDGVITTGTFTINEETNEITLNGNTLIQNDGNWMSPATNTFKVIKAFPGKVESKGIWFGTSYDATKDEWLSFHYIISSQ